MQTFADRITLVVNGLPVIHCGNVSDEVTTNRELVVGMSPTRTAIGATSGVKEYTLTIEAAVPANGDIQWEDISDGIVMMTNQGGTESTVYTGVFVKSVKRQYTDKGQAKRTIECGALTKLVSQARARRDA